MFGLSKEARERIYAERAMEKLEKRLDVLEARLTELENITWKIKG